MRQISKRILAIITTLLVCSVANADPDIISQFPLDNYNQNIATWINPNDADYNKPLITSEAQQQRQDEFYNHYFGSKSPWNENYVNPIFHQSAPDDVKTIQQTIIDSFNNQNKPANEINYGENYIPHSAEWIDKITKNINILQFNALTYQTKNRAIAITNLHARALPTDDPCFNSYKIAGEGYPFDNLQMSSIWVGTPLYILGETQDHAWSMVLTPDFIGWVKSNGIARVNDRFVNQWQAAAKNNLAAITRTETSLVDEKKQFLLYAYVGTVLPTEKKMGNAKLLLPVADSNHNATIKYINVSNDNFILMPLTATPHNFAAVMSTLIGRPYGWGNMYFYNDCSAELKNLYTPFGIFLPRHSSNQVTVGKMVDMTSASPEQRLAYLMANGQKLMTIVYIGGHIFMYLGNYTDPTSHGQVAMTYQDVWGLSPVPAVRRAVIGKAVLIPLLLQFPEDTSLSSEAAKSFFQVAYLDQIPINNLKSEIINLRALMFPSV